MVFWSLAVEDDTADSGVVEVVGEGGMDCSDFELSVNMMLFFF